VNAKTLNKNSSTCYFCLTLLAIQSKIC
jgi:hypothetical protein